VSNTKLFKIIYYLYDNHIDSYRSHPNIEQLFPVLKGLYNLENPRLYGQARYERHIKWVLVAYLIDEYNKKQQGIKTRKYPWNL